MMSDVRSALENLTAAVKELTRSIEENIENHHLRNQAAAVVVSLAALEETLKQGQSGPAQIGEIPDT